MLPAPVSPTHSPISSAFQPMTLSHLDFLAAVFHTIFSPPPQVCTDKSLSPQAFLVSMPKIVPAVWPDFTFISLSTCYHGTSLMSTEYLVLDCTDREPSVGGTQGFPSGSDMWQTQAEQLLDLLTGGWSQQLPQEGPERGSSEVTLGALSPPL